jgi:hypothetical protein
MEKRKTWYCNSCEHHHYEGVPCPKVTAREKLIKSLTEEDVVNNPSHYQIGGLEIEALDVIRGVLSHDQYIGYLRGNILKYQMRANKKNDEEDLRKANYYSRELDIFLDGKYD